MVTRRVGAQARDRSRQASRVPGRRRQRTMKTRAAQAGQPLQAYLRSLIEREASRPTVAEAVERARRDATASISTADILSAIDEGRARR